MCYEPSCYQPDCEKCSLKESCGNYIKRPAFKISFVRDYSLHPWVSDYWLYPWVSDYWSYPSTGYLSPPPTYTTSDNGHLTDMRYSIGGVSICRSHLPEVVFNVEEVQSK